METDSGLVSQHKAHPSPLLRGKDLGAQSPPCPPASVSPWASRALKLNSPRVPPPGPHTPLGAGQSPAQQTHTGLAFSLGADI